MFACAAVVARCSFQLRRSLRLAVSLTLCPAVRHAVLLRADDCWYRGTVDDQYRAHGDGCWLEQFGLITVELSGTFQHGQLPHGTLRFPNGVQYEGGLQRRRPHGAGVLTHPDGCSFKGEWKEGKAVSGALRSAPTAATAAAASESSSISDAAETKNEPIAAVRFIGERDPLGLPHGLGCEVNAAGKMIAGRGGEWAHGSFAFERSLPLRLVPQELFTEERGQSLCACCLALGSCACV